MIYILMDGYYTEYDVWQVLEGPEGVDLDAELARYKEAWDAEAWDAIEAACSHDHGRKDDWGKPILERVKDCPEHTPQLEAITAMRRARGFVDPEGAVDFEWGFVAWLEARGLRRVGFSHINADEYCWGDVRGAGP